MKRASCARVASKPRIIIGCVAKDRTIKLQSIGTCQANAVTGGTPEDQEETPIKEGD